MTNMQAKRIGTVGINTYGSKMTVVEYNKFDDLWVRFEQGELVHTRWNEFKRGMVKNPYDKSVQGVGYIGKGKYKVSVDRIPTCQYKTWHSMMTRCYKESFHEKNPSYIDSSVSEEWHNFQVFAKWWDENYYEVDGEKMQLDKDILEKGNKIYSSKSCVFAPQRINALFTKNNVNRGGLPIGVHYRKDRVISPYQASCSDGKGTRVFLNFFDNPKDAFCAYKMYKEKIIKQLAEEYKGRIPDKLYNGLIDYEIEIND